MLAQLRNYCSTTARLTSPKYAMKPWPGLHCKPPTVCHCHTRSLLVGHRKLVSFSTNMDKNNVELSMVLMLADQQNSIRSDAPLKQTSFFSQKPIFVGYMYLSFCFIVHSQCAQLARTWASRRRYTTAFQSASDYITKSTRPSPIFRSIEG